MRDSGVRVADLLILYEKNYVDSVSHLEPFPDFIMTEGELNRLA